MDLPILRINRKQAWLICLFAAASIYSKTASATPENSVSSYADSIIVQKQLNNKKHQINIYPDACHEVLFFNVKSEEKKKYQLYIFDIEGSLVKQANISANQTTVLKEFQNGIYLFDVFSDDKRIESGQVVFQ